MRTDSAERTLRPRRTTASVAARLALATVVLAILSACGSLTEVPTGPIGEVPDRLPLEGPTESAVWLGADVGAVQRPGSVEVQGDGSVLVISAGEDVWSTADAFHFVYTELSGSMDISVRVEAIDADGVWAKAGLMIREGLEPGARNVFLPLTAARGAVLQARMESNGITIDTLAGGIVMQDTAPTAPWWLRLSREGNTVIGYVSPDGTAWSELGRVDVALSEDVYAGLALTNHSSERPASGRFADLRVVGRPAKPKPSPTPTPTPVPGDRTVVDFQADPADVRNPERGWYSEPWTQNYAAAASRGDTLAMRYVRLDEYRDRALPASFLDTLNADLASARGSGVKLVLRFAYNRTFGPDAPVDVVLQHIAQLTPILRAQSDIIAVVQAGFIGAWGEWHTSTNGLTDSANRERITRALLDAVDPSRSVQIRYPYYARELFPQAGTTASAFAGTAESRVGLMNDCFLANGTDGGTYLSDADSQYTATVSRVAPMGGETCDIGGLHDRNGCANALRELSMYHWDYLNREFFMGVLERWQAEGCYDEIARRLGYRFVLESAAAPSAAAAGQVVEVSVTIGNEGFGKLYNPRPIEVVLVPRAGGPSVPVRVVEDARSNLPLASETRILDLSVRLPSDLASGTYDLHLFLPDASDALRHLPAYSVRFANLGTWEAGSGFNDLGLSVAVAGR